MTISLPSRIAIPISALLAPSDQSPSLPLPSPSLALLGPLPPTTPLHLALNYLALSDLPEWQSSAAPESARKRGRVLVVTGPREGYRSAIEEEDEDWLRERGGDYGVLARFKRVDMRYCSTSKHVMLLLSLLSSNRRADPDDAKSILHSPGLIILWDLARLFMEEEEPDENLPDQGKKPKSEGMRFRNDVALSSYLHLVAAARGMMQQLDNPHGNAQLIILEPNLATFSSLPILRGETKDSMAKMATPTRERRISIRDALESLLGPDAIGLVDESTFSTDDDDPNQATHTVKFSAYPNESFAIRRRRCGRSQWAPARAEEDAAGREPGEGVTGDRGGWRWDWLSQPS